MVVDALLNLCLLQVENPCKPRADLATNLNLHVIAGGLAKLTKVSTSLIFFSHCLMISEYYPTYFKPLYLQHLPRPKEHFLVVHSALSED